MPHYQIVKFKGNNIEIDVNVSPNEETVWLTKEQISILFDRDRSVISRHINNIFKEGELDKKTSVHFLHISDNETNPRHRPPEYYNLDVIISIGYRVKSKNGILFRKWAINVLRNYLLKGYVIDNNRTLITNENYINLINRVDTIDKRLSDIEKIELNKEKVFFDGEFIDAKSFISQLISIANKSIILIDSYADIKALDFLKHKKEGVVLSIYHCSKAKLSIQDINDFNNQYGMCSAYINDRFHDRFLIIDDIEIYHLGASLNYAGKKVFAVTKMEDREIIESIKKEL